MSGVRPLSYLLMPNELAKTTALPPKIFCQDALSVVTVAERGSNSPSYLLNAQRLGKMVAKPQKKPWLRKIYILQRPGSAVTGPALRRERSLLCADIPMLVTITTTRRPATDLGFVRSRTHYPETPVCRVILEPQRTCLFGTTPRGRTSG